jgi:hypothetical protein
MIFFIEMVMTNEIGNPFHTEKNKLSHAVHYTRAGLPLTGIQLAK